MLPILNFSSLKQNTSLQHISSSNVMDNENKAHLVILEEPSECFRFRYKSETQGTHGSLYGSRSEKTKKTYPEVKLNNFTKSGIIRCSLYQANTSSLHSHMLVFRKDDCDVNDPHDLPFSPEKGYIALYENMRIVHTAKKDIVKELLNKKIKKFKFDSNCDFLTTKQLKALRDETEREAKLMNVNQVRLCFEAFQNVGGRFVKICEPVFSRPINNRKSALTGELKICRLSIATGSAAGGDDLILLVEKVSKNNIKVRFYELVNEEETWEAYGSFTEADVHHQYAIVVLTPQYKDKDIEDHVNVFIELVRESDNARSHPVSFRYKPRDIILSRKRRKTATSISSSSSSLPNSFESSEKINMSMRNERQRFKTEIEPISKNAYQSFIDTDTFMRQVNSDFSDCDKLENLFGDSLLLEPFCDLESDGSGVIVKLKQSLSEKFDDDIPTSQHFNSTLKLVLRLFNNRSKNGLSKTIKDVQSIFQEYVAKNDNGDTIIHDIIKQKNKKDAICMFQILLKLNLTNLLSQVNNTCQTPLHLACLYNRDIFIGPLLSLSCDPNIQDSKGNTALHICINENLRKCFESLVANASPSQLNVNLKNDEGMTSLHLAIRKNNFYFVRTLLLQYNASPKISNSLDGNNALHIAINTQNKDIIRIILESTNVDLNTPNQAGYTAIDIASNLRGPIRNEILDILCPFMPLSMDIKTEHDSDETSTESEIENPLKIDLKRTAEQIAFKQKLQKDEEICQKLGEVLNKNDKWKHLGKILKLDHLLFIWPNAEAMIKWILKEEEIKILNLLKALQEIDSEAAWLLKSLLNN